MKHAEITSGVTYVVEAFSAAPAPLEPAALSPHKTNRFQLSHMNETGGSTGSDQPRHATFNMQRRRKSQRATAAAAAEGGAKGKRENKTTDSPIDELALTL
jgi:hypothetical protein